MMVALISRSIAWAAFATLIVARPYDYVRSVVPATTTVPDSANLAILVTLWVGDGERPLSIVAQDEELATSMTTASIEAASTVANTAISLSSTNPAVADTLAPWSGPLDAPSTISSSSTVWSATSSQDTPTSTRTASQVLTSAGKIAGATAAASPPPTLVMSQTVATGGDATVVQASDTNSCEGIGKACQGDITHYDGGLGACGWNVDSASDMQIALPAGFMGTQSNGNPYCGRHLTIRNPTTGAMISATVGEKCMSCTGRSIDLTDALFEAIGGGCDGRCSGFQWWF